MLVHACLATPLRSLLRSLAAHRTPQSHLPIKMASSNAAVTNQPPANGGASGLVAPGAVEEPRAGVSTTMVGWGPGELGRGCCWTIATCPYRATQATRLSSITEQQKDFAHFCNVSYNDPGDRPTELRGYELLQDDMPLRDGVDESGATTEPLNGQRWMVYRHPNRVNHVLVFRGTVDKLDMEYDAHLLTKGLADHKLVMDSAAFSLRAMIFLEKQAKDEGDARAGGAGSLDTTCLKFWVAGHSLGGSTAMGVMLLLNDPIDMVATLEDSAKSNKTRRQFLETYKEKIADVYTAAAAESGTSRPYDLVGGDIFNPGSAPRCLLFSNPWVCLFGCLSTPAWIISRCGMFWYRLCTYRHHGPGADQLVNNHHILGDTISMTFRMGKEKSYWPNHWKVHAIAQFL
ncbi:unnamed protein product [Ectocarpus sp. 13 AM-2016]